MENPPPSPTYEPRRLRIKPITCHMTQDDYNCVRAAADLQGKSLQDFTHAALLAAASTAR